MVSLPASPQMTSFPFVPVNMSLRAVPVMVHFGRGAASVEGTAANSDTSKIATITMNEFFCMQYPFCTDTQPIGIFPVDAIAP